MFVRPSQFILKGKPVIQVCSPARTFTNASTLKTLSSSLSDSVVNNALDENRPLPREAKVVICGAGVMGASVAYHLAELGWGPHTVLIDQGK